VRLLEGIVLVHLDVLFHILPAVDIVDTDAVHTQTVARGGEADDLEHGFVAALHRVEVDHDIGARHDPVHSLLDRCGDIVSLLQRGVAGDHDGNIGEGVRPAAPGAHAPRPEHTRHHDRPADLAGQVRGDGIEQGADSPFAQLQTDMNHDAGDDEGGRGISFDQPGDAGPFGDQHQDQTHQNHQ